MSDEKKAKPTQVITGVCRLFYVNAFQARANDQGVEKYSVQGLIPKGDAGTLAMIRAAIIAAKAEFEKKFKMKFPASGKLPIRDGDAELDDETKDDPDYRGHFFFNASSKQKPGLVDAQGQEIISQSELYSGVFGRLIINFYPYDVKGNKGIAAGLNGIQKIRDGEPKSGVGSVSEVFGRYENADGEQPDQGLGF